MTGTFRNLSSEIWDPHPQYMIEAFGHRLHLMLKQDTSFIPTNTFKVIRILNNQTEDYEDQGHYLGCYYKGHVEGHNQSSVSVSLCSGMVRSSLASAAVLRRLRCDLRIANYGQKYDY